MTAIFIYDLIPKRLLTSRQSVDVVLPQLIDAAVKSGQPITLDFDGIEGVAPSVLDQIIISLKHLLPSNSADGIDLVFLHVPADLGTKYQAVARAHQRKFVSRADGAWVLAHRNPD